jgi:hypothetical protein
MTTQMPEEAIGAVSGLYYKIGLHGKAYYWNGEEWIKSDKTSEEIKAALARKMDRLSLSE